MPIYKTDEEKSENRLKLEPIRLNTVHRRIMRLEIAGRRPGEIAVEVGITPSRLSIITGSSLYKVERDRMKVELERLFTEGVVERDVEHPVRRFLTAEAYKSAETLVELRDGAKAELVRRQSAVDILDRAGFKVPKEEAKGDAPVEVGEGLANAIRTAIQVMQQKVELTVNVNAPAESVTQPSTP